MKYEKTFTNDLESSANCMYTVPKGAKPPLGHTLFPTSPALFHPLLPMNIPDRKVAPKPDTQFHQSPFISCHPIEAEKGHVRWNPDLLRK